MANWATIHSKIWEDKKFRRLTVLGQHLFIFFCTHPNMTLSGIFEINIEFIRDKYVYSISNFTKQLFEKILLMPLTDELEKDLSEYAKKSFEDIFGELIEKNLIKFDDEKELLFICHRFKYLPNHYSRNVIQGVLKELDMIEHPFKRDFLKIYEDKFRYYKIFIDNVELSEKELNDPEQVKAIKNLLTTKDRVTAFLTHKNCEPEAVKRIIGRMFEQEA